MLDVLLMDGFNFNRIHSRLGYHFLAKLGKYCNLTLYGSNQKEVLDKVDKKFTDKIRFVEHSNHYNVDDMITACGKPDVILMHQYVSAKSLKPKGFETCKIPKALILFDTYVNENHTANKKKIDFAQSQNINLIIRRGCQSFYDNELWNIPSVWLPFSVREETFYTDPTTQFLYGRSNLVTFVGSGYESKNILYPTLKKSVDILKQKGLMSYQGIVGLEKYPNALKTCVAALSYVFEQYRGHPAKLFELMGSGTAVITPSFSNRTELFGEEEVCWFYNNPDELKDIVPEILHHRNREELYRRTRNALNVINSRHLDHYRCIELVNILKALAGGSQIPSLWE